MAVNGSTTILYVFPTTHRLSPLLTKGISLNKTSMSILRELFWLSVKYNFHITARHLPGSLNTVNECFHKYQAPIGSCQRSSVLCVAEAILQKLDDGVSNAVFCAWRDNTKKARASQWRQFMNFCQNLGLIAVLADSRTVARFLVLKAETCKFSTINNYLSAIMVLRKCYGYQPYYRDEFMMKLVLDGLEAILGTSVTQKVPLTPLELLMIYKNIDQNDELGLVFWSIIVFCFQTILRKSNVIPEKDSFDDLLVCRNGIKFYDWGMMVSVLSTKTIKYRERNV